MKKTNFLVIITYSCTNSFTNFTILWVSNKTKKNTEYDWSKLLLQCWDVLLDVVGPSVIFIFLFVYFCYWQTHIYVDQAKNERWISEPLYTAVKVSLKNFFLFSNFSVFDFHLRIFVKIHLSKKYSIWFKWLLNKNSRSCIYFSLFFCFLSFYLFSPIFIFKILRGFILQCKF